MKFDDRNELFPELSISLLCWTERLYEALLNQGADQVFFLSREGQPLMGLFEIYQNRVGGNIKSHYLEVSRRSTLLPSLVSLANENFENLFRQYRCISLLEFLSSLGLEAQVGDIAHELSLSDGTEAQREDDFPTSHTFAALKSLPLFQELYELERTSRRSAFINYLLELSGGTLPVRLVVVDVGWKGTIQDNLYAMLCRNADTGVHGITGYYVGLVGTGAAGTRNDKHGLLFSSVDKSSAKFRVFNENRALFEVVLAADHGSIVSYETTSVGRAHAIRGDFDEGEMLAREVFPVQRQLFANFERLLVSTPLTGKGYVFSFDDVWRSHARMVFKPTTSERVWFSSVFHEENYGVFERSYFSTLKNQRGLIVRLRFLKELLQRRNTGALGFWPWCTIYERGGTLAAFIYATIRRLQR